MTQEEPYIWSNGKKLLVLTLGEALRRRGFSFENLEHTCMPSTKENLVAFNPDAQATLNKGGDPWSFCGGVMIFSFSSVQKENGSDRYYALSHSYGISADMVDATYGKKIIFRLVQPC